jgi:hypothetical protein
MKTKILVLISIFICVSAFSQGIKLPKAVSESFKKLYPNATEVKWEKEGSNEYEAIFKNGETKVSIAMDKKGNLNETETVIKINDLPNGVTKYIEENYKGFTVEVVEKTEDNKGKITYEVQVKKDKVKKEVKFDKDGKLLKSKK